ncbi:MAG: Zn-ribbon domain-containing OB-fold protein [Acidimicrobiales bacterium]
MTSDAAAAAALNLGAVVRDERSAPFFDATAEGQLLIHRCPACDHRFGPELATCTACGAPDPEWEPATGTASVVSWVVVHRKDAHGSPATTTVVTAELPEGPWLTLPLHAPDDSGLSAGTTLHVSFVRPDLSEAIPVWQR